jgi:arsenate reductase (thioredoxin)
MSTKPAVLFVCLHNAGRSQMAARYLNHLSGGAIKIRCRWQRASRQDQPP